MVCSSIHPDHLIPFSEILDKFHCTFFTKIDAVLVPHQPQSSYDQIPTQSWFSLGTSDTTHRDDPRHCRCRCATSHMFSTHATAIHHPRSPIAPAAKPSPSGRLALPALSPPRSNALILYIYTHNARSSERNSSPPFHGHQRVDIKIDRNGSHGSLIKPTRPGRPDQVPSRRAPVTLLATSFHPSRTRRSNLRPGNPAEVYDGVQWSATWLTGAAISLARRRPTLGTVWILRPSLIT